MTTDGTPDYPGWRDEAQRQDDRATASAQSAALSRSNTDQRAQADDVISQLLARRRTLRSELSDPLVPIEVLRRPGRPDHGDERGRIVLVVRGELLLLVPADAASASRPGHDDRSDGDVPPWQQASRLLHDLGYRTPILHDFPRGALPLQTYFTHDRDAEQLVRDRDQVRRETGAEVDLNYVCTTGYLTKGEDAPVETAAIPWYPPSWFENHPVQRSVTVAVIDTGINREQRTDQWLATVAENAQNEDPLDVLPADGVLDSSAGHGTFVSGIVQQVDPECDIRVYRAMDTDGLGQSKVVADAVVQAAADGADIINLSLGTETVDDQPPTQFTAALATLQAQYPEVLVVASAGNNGDETPVFPAAMNGVIAVGALNPPAAPGDQPTPVKWSSFGPWVQCSSIGVGVASTFVEGLEQPAGQPSQQFGPNAWAIWSGTSFSAAQITGAVALYAQLYNLDPAVALNLLLNPQLLDPPQDPLPTLPNFGYLVTLLPGS